MEVLKRHDWPGNIRELQNFVERAVIMTTGPTLRPPVAELARQKIATLPSRTLADTERAHIIAMLRETNWVVGGQNGAAAKLGLPRTTLIARMHKLGISRETFSSRENQPIRVFAKVPAMYSHTPESIRQDDYVGGHASSGFGNNSSAHEHRDASLARAAGF
jgi:formate hydrogenlyase transcriptional activator